MSEWPFVGRAELLDRLVGLTVGGERRGAVLVGRAGVGKTTIAERCVKAAVAAGMTAERVRATKTTQPLPFGALAALLPDDRDVPAAQDLAALLQLYASRLIELAGDGRLVLLVDDAHLLDDASVVLVHELARRGDVTLVVTLRTGERAPEEIVALWKERILERVDVGGLDLAAIRDLLVDVLRGPVDPVVAERVNDRSRGNPLFVRELVAAARDDGTLRKEDGTWRLTGWPAVSDRLADLVRAHLAKLTPEEEHVLELLAFAEPLGSLELDALGLHAAAESLERRDLAVSGFSGRRLELRLAHPIFGDVVRALLRVPRRERIALSRADVLETTGLRRREDALAVATWRLVSGGGSAELLLAGAASARRRHDYALTERLATAAIDAGAGFDARFLAAQVLSLRGCDDEAEERLLVLASDATTDRERVSIAGARIDAALRSCRPAMPILEEAEATITEQPWRDQLVAGRSAVLMITEGYRAAAEAAAPMIERGDSLSDQLYVIAIHNLNRLGRLREALALLERARAAPGAGTTYGAWEAELLHRTIESLFWAGRLREAEALAVPALRRAVVETDLMVEAYAAAALSRCQLELGHPRTAVATATQSFRVFRTYGRLLPAREPAWAAALALAVLGDVTGANKVLAETKALPGTIVFDGPRAVEVEGWIAAATGDLARARQRLDAAANQFVDLGDLQNATAAVHGIARLGNADMAADRLEALAREMDGDLAPARAAHAAALAAHDAPALERVARTFGAMGADLYAAEAEAAASIEHRRADRPRDAAAAARRAAVLAARCEGARTPALQGVETRAQLTPTELETARLAAAGHSNREIADRLVVSVRTVENRLYRIYEKLGVPGRGLLARALRDL